MLSFLQDWLTNIGLTETIGLWVARAIAVFGILILSFISNLIARHFFLRGMRFLIRRSKTAWDDAVLDRQVLTRIVRIVPAMVIYLLVPVALTGLPGTIGAVRNAVLIYMILVSISALDGLLNAGIDIYRTFKISKEIHLKGLIQLLKILLYSLAVVLIVSILLGKSPVYFLSGLGAMTAVLLLIFKDSLLGLVAGIQLTANRMIAQGDWIEMPKYGVDGDVLEVSLTTVKVQNWDKTIATVPTYSLISESFKNWRGMQESGGRRIKRALNIDMNSIKFCNEEMLRRYAKIKYISAYLEAKKQELETFNAQKETDMSSLVNGRRLTNVGTFRAYIQAYLENHPMISKDMTFLVRQLKPGESGLPIEIYVFSKDQRWANYEQIQADIFDHLLAAAPEFDLRIFQNPSGSDFLMLAKTTEETRAE